MFSLPNAISLLRPVAAPVVAWLSLYLHREATCGIFSRNARRAISAGADLFYWNGRRLWRSDSQPDLTRYMAASAARIKASSSLPSSG